MVKVKDSKNFSEYFTQIVLEADNENFLTDNEFYIVFLLKKINEWDSPSPYDLLTTYIFENDIDNAEELIALFDFSEEIFKNNVESYNDYGNVEHFFDSIRRHVNLAVIQQKHIVASSKEALKISEEAEKNINQTEEKIKKLEKDLNKAEQTIENMEKIKGSIYTEFIAILGIFSALIFGLFGGFDGLSKAIVSLSSKWSMGKVLTISSGIMLCLTLLIFALLQWVARITGRKLTSCDCYKEGKECTHSLFRRHRTLFSIIFSFIFVFILGEYIESYENIYGIYDFQQNHSKIFGFLAWGIPIIFIVMVLVVTWSILKKPKTTKLTTEKQ
ncbi:hypothetical protein [Enterococcus faecium]|uniref:hypothetical protein n=1 Tax=Enterococcus faecium TaxID=1352 RepID=UPI00177F2D17|nr:hypothetical protein [Enterococcus faecium]MBD9830922.1 hypothetical protein [Enterococcus faecium]